MTDPSADDLGLQKFAGTAGAYASSFALLCVGTVGPLLTAVGLGPATAGGLRILDVGTGTGSVIRRVAAWGGHAVAVDPDDGMRRLAALAAPSADIRTGVVPGLPFDDGQFDVVVANFVVNHATDPLAAVRDMARVAASGGRVGATIWPSDRGVLGAVWSGVAAVADEDWPQDPLWDDDDVPRNPEGISELFRMAGLVDVEARLLRWDTRIDPEQLWDGVAAGVAGIGQLVATQPAGVQTRMKAAYDHLVEPYRDADGLTLPTIAVLATGMKP